MQALEHAKGDEASWGHIRGLRGACAISGAARPKGHEKAAAVAKRSHEPVNEAWLLQSSVLLSGLKHVLPSHQSGLLVQASSYPFLFRGLLNGI